MKNYILIFEISLMFCCGGQMHNDKAAHQFNNSRVDESNSLSFQSATPADSIVLSKDDKAIKDLNDSIENFNFDGGLNSIRFRNWTEKDWYDNEYFRVLRKYIDSCYNGDIENKHLKPYKSILKGKFVIYNVNPYLLGGLFITIIFLDAPDKLFDTSVYSYVEASGEIKEYEVRGVHLREDEESGLSKNEILAIIKDHPENKLW